MLGAVLRFCGTLLGQSYLFPVMMLGQTLAALAQPLIIFTPTKQVALWFPDRQRATANTIATMCEYITGLFGVMATGRQGEENLMHFVISGLF